MPVRATAAEGEAANMATGQVGAPREVAAAATLAAETVPAAAAATETKQPRHAVLAVKSSVNIYVM
jgi:hypothetical protein